MASFSTCLPIGRLCMHRYVSYVRISICECCYVRRAFAYASGLSGSRGGVADFESARPRWGARLGRSSLLGNARALEMGRSSPPGFVGAPGIGRSSPLRLRWDIRISCLSLPSSHRGREMSARARRLTTDNSKWLREPLRNRRMQEMPVREVSEAAAYSKNVCSSSPQP